MVVFVDLDDGGGDGAKGCTPRRNDEPLVASKGIWIDANHDELGLEDLGELLNSS